MQTSGDIHPLSQRVAQDFDPDIGNDTTSIGHAHHQRLRACGNSLRDRHVLQAEIGIAALHTQLADRTLRPPVADALSHFGCQWVSGITQKQQIRFLNIHRSFPVFEDWCFRQVTCVRRASWGQSP